MEPSEEVCKALVIWLQTIVEDRTVVAITDGVAILQALIQMCPMHFYKLDGKIKTDVDSIWRIKLTNLKKILTTIVEYYNDVLNLQISPMGLPDLIKLCEQSDLLELGKLLRLILGCAVHCERKQEYITKIMAMEESVQRCIMQAIQELEQLIDGVGKSGLGFLSLDSNETKITKLLNDLDLANEAKESLAQQCHQLEAQVQSLQEEKQTLLSENHLLASQIKENHSIGPKGMEVRKQTDQFREEIFRLEAIRDDLSAKVQDQEKQIHALQERIADLQHAAEVNSRLKDEVDALSESAEKVKILEVSVNSYKKKLEDHLDTKKQIKILEEKNVEYLQQNMKLEEELKKHAIWKNSSESYKGQVAELQTKLDEETRQLDKAVFQNKNLESKIEALQNEKERINRECVALREENEELRLNSGNKRPESGAAMSQELAPTEMKERLRFLERENQTLRATSQDVESKQLHLDDALNRSKKLTEQNRVLNQRILELEAQLDNQKPETGVDSIKEYKQKVQQLQETLTSKEQDLQLMHSKYARSVEKAREISANFDKDLKNNGSIESIRHQSAIRDEEDRLISTAFYRLTMQLHRDTVDERLALLSAAQGQSFLNRQRQAVPRKPVTPFKSK